MDGEVGGVQSIAGLLLPLGECVGNAREARRNHGTHVIGTCSHACAMSISILAGLIQATVAASSSGPAGGHGSQRLRRRYAVRFVWMDGWTDDKNACLPETSRSSIDRRWQWHVGNFGRVPNCFSLRFLPIHCTSKLIHVLHTQWADMETYLPASVMTRGSAGSGDDNDSEGRELQLQVRDLVYKECVCVCPPLSLPSCWVGTSILDLRVASWFSASSSSSSRHFPLPPPNNQKQTGRRRVRDARHEQRGDRGGALGQHGPAVSLSSQIGRCGV
jgi:hypothetical protein